MRFSIITILTAITAVQAAAVHQGKRQGKSLNNHLSEMTRMCPNVILIATDGQACTGIVGNLEQEGTCDDGRCSIFTPPNEVGRVPDTSGIC